MADALSTAGNVGKSGMGFLGGLFNFLTKPTTLIAGTLLLGTYISTGGLGPMIQAVTNTMATGLGGLAEGIQGLAGATASLSASTEPVAAALSGSGAAAAPVYSPT